MITLTAKIELGQGAINSVDISGNDYNGSNSINIASNGNALIGKNKQVDISKTFTLNESRLGGGDTYATPINYFMGRIKSDSNGNFPENYSLDISGNNIKAVTISFNELDNEFPNYVLVDGEKFVDDDIKWEIVFENQSLSHTIQIPNWNKPNSPLVITGIYVDLVINIDKANLMSLSREIADRTNVKYPQYGIISNHGDISFIDVDETVLDLIIQQAIGKNKIDLYINNTTTGSQEQIASFYTKDWSYDNNNRQVSITIKDLLEKWQDINVAPIYYVPTISTSKPLSYIYEYLWNITKSKGYSMVSLDELDDTTKSLLTNIIEYPVLEGANLWEEWNKLCQAVLAHIYIDNKGKIIFKHTV